jgi:hypothetical protein
MAVCALLGIIRNDSDVDTHDKITFNKNKKFLIARDLHTQKAKPLREKEFSEISTE